MLEEKLKEAFFWFHKHPELSYEEYETTAKIKELLTEAGIEILPLSLETGLVAVIRGAKEGAVTVLRCDIDGLPITEESGLGYSSCTQGKMHACGHDFHIVSVLGAALLLQERRKELKGTVKILFQPAEESSLGALKILETDVLKDVESIFGIHAAPAFDVGTLAIRTGSVTAAVDRFVIRIKGTGCHGAHPDDGIDPIIVSAAIIQSLQTIVSRNINTFHPAVLSVTRVEAGSTWNVIPQTAEMEGTVRTLDKEDRTLFENRVKQIAQKTAEAFGALAEVEWVAGPPATQNDEKITALSKKVAYESGFHVVPGNHSMGGEDFAFYQEEIPGCFIMVGTGKGHPIHHPGFKVSPEALRGTAEYLSCLAQEALLLSHSTQ